MTVTSALWSGAGSPAGRSFGFCKVGFRFDMPLYHGTATPPDAPIAAFDLARAGTMSLALPARFGVWASRDPSLAGDFASLAAGRTGSAPHVLPLLHRASRPAVIELRGDEMNHEIASTLAQAWDEGFDAVLFRNFSTDRGSVDIVVVKDPAQLRSRFARFDPAKRDSADLLAADVGGGPAGAAMAVARHRDVDDTERKRRKKLGR